MKKSEFWKSEGIGAEPQLPLQMLFVVMTGVLIAAVIVITLGPVGWRPHLIGANVDRFVGFLVLGSFLALMQPKRFFIVCAAIIMGAVFLEYSQTFFRGRHGGVHDFEFKVVGGLLGAGFARALTGTIRIF